MLRKTIGRIIQYYQYILAAALIILLVLIVYAQDLQILVNEAFQNEALSHILLMPFFAGVLLYLKKDMVKASLALEKHKKQTKTRYIDPLLGVILCLTAFLLYWYGSYTFYPLEYHILSLPIFLLGTTLILFNFKAMMVLILPILFLLFLVPPPMEFVYSLGGTLGNFNTQASYTLLKAFNLPVELSTSYGPPTITLTTSQTGPAFFTIGLPCSGIYSLIAFCMFAVFLALTTSASVPRKIIVAAIGFVTFEALNIIRITTIVSIAYQFGQAIAMYLFHTVAGLVLIFIGMLFTLFIADKFLKVPVTILTKEQTPCPKCTTSLKKRESFCLNCGRLLGNLNKSVRRDFWPKILILLVGCFIVTLSINAPTFAFAQDPIGIAYTANWENSSNAFPNITGYLPPTFLYRDSNYEAIAQQDAALWYSYYSANYSQPTIYVAINIANSISNLHNWEVCLVSWQIEQGQHPLATVLDSREVQLLPDVPIIARYFTFTSPYNYTQVTLYWYEKATFKTGITVEQKYVRTSLIILTENSTDSKQLEHLLLPVGQIIASYWEPLKNQALVSLGIPTQQALLAASLALVAFTETGQYLSTWRNRNINRKIFDNFASAKEKIVFHAVQDLKRQRKTMKTQDVEEAIERTIGKSVKLSTLVRILRHLEENGFIKRDIVSLENRPLLVWRTCFDY